MQTIKPLIFLLFLYAYPFESICYAKSLGVYGATFEILEPDFKEFIYARLNQLQQSGELEKLNQKFLANVKNHTLRPTPVAGLTITNNPKSFYYDPTYVLKEDIKDAAGKVITAKGTTINPFDLVTMHSVMLFFNSDDKKQIKWAKEEAKKHSYIKYVLVQGNIKESSNTLEDQVYFDQYGTITKQLGIKHIPCLVQQEKEKKKLKIQEFSLDEAAEINKQKEKGSIKGYSKNKLKNLKKDKEDKEDKEDKKEKNNKISCNNKNSGSNYNDNNQNNSDYLFAVNTNDSLCRL